jgi:hypothetical protein
LFTDFAGIDIERLGIDVNQDGTRSGANDRACGCEEAERSRNDRIPGLNSSSYQREPESVGSGGTTHSMSSACEGRDLFFQCFDFSAQYEVLGTAHALNGTQDFWPNACVLPLKIEQWD